MSPDALTDCLDGALPGFRRFVESEENLYEQDNVHGVFVACSDFVRERDVSLSSWKQVAEVVNGTVKDSDEELDNAVCTCFLENLAETDHPLRALLRGEALEYWKRWE